MPEHLSEGAAVRLGDLLYAGPGKPRIREREWLELVMSVAAGSQSALHALYVRSHRVVYTLAMRITKCREAAGEATVDTFQDVWRRARAFDPAEATVLGWIMGHARARAIARMPQGARADREESSAELLDPDASVQSRLATRIAEDSGARRMVPPLRWSEPEWDDVGTGIACKRLADDDERDRVSMLVRLAPGAGYPPHAHAGVEELHLLQGELWIEDRKLLAGGYNRAQAPSVDHRVQSETGCACVLITSTRDILR